MKLSLSELRFELRGLEFASTNGKSRDKLLYLYLEVLP